MNSNHRKFARDICNINKDMKPKKVDVASLIERDNCDAVESFLKKKDLDSLSIVEEDMDDEIDG